MRRSYGVDRHGSGPLITAIVCGLISVFVWPVAVFAQSPDAAAAKVSTTPRQPLFKPAGARSFDFWYARSGETWHAFYLRGEDGAPEGVWSVGRATSDDLVSWTDKGAVLRADPTAPWCNRSIATGSTWRGPTRWQMLVTAHGGVGGNIGLAESDDLERWEMVGPVQIDLREHAVPRDAAWRAGGLTAGATIRYQILADPYVMPEPNDGWWYMIANSIVTGLPVNERGCIGMLRSKDGRHWEDQGIIAFMLDYDRPETPQLWRHGDRWYLYYGGAREGDRHCRHNRLSVSRSMHGPFEPAPRSEIVLPDARRFYIAKVLPAPRGGDVLLGAIDGSFMSLPYPVTYEADGSLTLGTPPAQAAP